MTEQGSCVGAERPRPGVAPPQTPRISYTGASVVVSAQTGGPAGRPKTGTGPPLETTDLSHTLTRSWDDARPWAPSRGFVKNVKTEASYHRPPNRTGPQGPSGTQNGDACNPERLQTHPLPLIPDTEEPATLKGARDRRTCDPAASSRPWLTGGGEGL